MLSIVEKNTRESKEKNQFKVAVLMPALLDNQQALNKETRKWRILAELVPPCGRMCY